MSQTYEEYEREVLAEIHREIDLENPVLNHFELVRFTSRKNGDVSLVHNRDSNRFTSWHLFPFDEVATEYIAGEDTEQKFIEILLAGSSEPDR